MYIYIRHKYIDIEIYVLYTCVGTHTYTLSVCVCVCVCVWKERVGSNLLELNYREPEDCLRRQRIG